MKSYEEENVEDEPPDMGSELPIVVTPTGSSSRKPIQTGNGIHLVVCLTGSSSGKPIEIRKPIQKGNGIGISNFCPIPGYTVKLFTAH